MSNTVRRGAAVLLLTLATACAQPRHYEQLADDARSMCVAAGFRPHTEDFPGCTLAVMQSERANDIQMQHTGTGAGIQAVGGIVGVLVGVLLPFLLVF